MHTSPRLAGLLAITLLLALVVACGRRQPPVARPAPPPGLPPMTSSAPPAPPEPVGEPPMVPAEPVVEPGIDSRSLDDLNRDSPLKPVFFAYDSAEIEAEGQRVLTENAGLLKKFSTWVVTIEGHCDERGTAEYNLALGERRALASRSYLISLGVGADRIRTVSYGKEFPFDPGHAETSWAKNRRAHFVITAR